MNDRETLSALAVIDFWTRHSKHDLKRQLERLERCEGANAEELAGICAAAKACLQSMQSLKDQFNAYDESNFGRFRGESEEISEDEVRRLLDLNRVLTRVSDHIREAAKDIVPRMEAKLADPADPMVDYEMDAYLSYQLREDDPAYQENEDNIVTTRQHGMKNFDLFEMDWTVTAPPWLQTGPHCYLFHDLYDHRDHFGGEERSRPWLPFRNCLRIGSVWLDVTVLQQYEYEVPDEPGA